MDKWISILLTVEEMWEVSCEHLISDPTTEEYVRKRDTFKARRIYDLYGYDYFLRFVERCPHIQDLIYDYLPCERGDKNCSMYCTLYKGGCTYGTYKRLD